VQKEQSAANISVCAAVGYAAQLSYDCMQSELQRFTKRSLFEGILKQLLSELQCCRRMFFCQLAYF